MPGEASEQYDCCNLLEGMSAVHSESAEAFSEVA